MELKRLVSHFTYRIEPKAEGGFIAQSTDPTAPPLDAASREELLQKIQAKIAANLASEFPGLKLPLENKEFKGGFHIERTPGGGFAIHSADGNAPPIETATHEEFEGHLAEKLIALLGKDIAPELQALATQGKAGEIRVVVNRKTGSTVRTLILNRGSLPSAGSIQPDAAEIEDAGLRDPIGNAPITPESSRGWISFSLLALLAVAALIYFFFYRR
jgi:hypothetical protein